MHSALAPIDVLTRVELEESLHKSIEAAERSRVRGIDYMEQNGNGDGVATVQIPGPESGYAWSVKVISFVVSAPATVNVYISESTTTAPVGTAILAAAGPAIFTFTSNIVVVRDGRVITLTTSAGGITAWKVLAKQVPNEMVGKL